MIEAISNCSAISIPVSSARAAAPYDYQKLAFHIESDDYFPYLSTLLSFVEEMLTTGESSEELIGLQLAAVQATRKDLGYLHDHFRIESRS